MEAEQKNQQPTGRKRALNCLWIDVEQQQQHPLVRQRGNVHSPLRYNDGVLAINGWTVNDVGEASKSWSSDSPQDGYGISIFSRDPDLSGDRATPTQRSPTHRAHHVTPLPLDMDEWMLEDEDLALIIELFELTPSSC